MRDHPPPQGVVPNDLRPHGFSVWSSARLHQSVCVFQFYVYSGIFDNPPGLLSARGTYCFFFFFSSSFV
jgi:hypothetical protein